MPWMPGGMGGGVTEQDSSVCLLMLLLPHPVLLLVFVSK